MVERAFGPGTEGLRRGVLASAFLLALPLAFRAAPALAFCEEAPPLCAANAETCANVGVPLCHREITEQGLSFLRPRLLERVVHTNLHMDHDHTTTLWSHFD